MSSKPTREVKPGDTVIIKGQAVIVKSVGKSGNGRQVKYTGQRRSDPR